MFWADGRNSRHSLKIVTRDVFVTLSHGLSIIKFLSVIHLASNLGLDSLIHTGHVKLGGSVLDVRRCNGRNRLTYALGVLWQAIQVEGQ